MLEKKVNIKKLDDKAKLPTYGSEFAAGADLYACMDEAIDIAPNTTEFIHTGLAFQIPEGYVGLVYARSGLGCKKGLAPANKVGVIDSDYRGEVMVALRNHSTETRTIEPGDKIAQMVLTPYLKADYQIADELDDTIRGAGGFGSTGTK
ncbi:MAG: dUTP diphosphatase [Bacilli bacterium]